jgi:hypothetical protein
MQYSTFLGKWRGLLLTTVLALAGGTVLPALAQAQGATPASGPPAQAGTRAKPSAAPSAPRQRIELPAAERKALEDGSTTRPAAGPTPEELVPSAADAKSPEPEERTHIEEVRTSNRITEIRVTPALTGRTYTMTNREGRQPTSATDTFSGLSVPKFFTFEFGRTDERPAASVPPPPTSSTPR